MCSSDHLVACSIHEVKQLVSMDPMEQAEAEMLRKEEENRRDLESAIGLENFLDRRDFSDRG